MKETLIDWLGTFWKVLVLPTPQTFLAEAKKADGKFVSATGWLVFFAIYLCILGGVAVGEPLSILTFMTALLAIPISVILATSALNFIFQRVFHRKKYLYDKILYITVAVLLPIFIIATLLFLVIPPGIFIFIAYILFFYQVVLLMIGMKAIVDIEYWQALVCVFLSIIVGIVTGGIAAIMVFATTVPVQVINSSR